MIRRQFGICYAVVVCISLSGCILATHLSDLSTQWSENFALAPYGTVANHPALNDGNLETVGVVHPVKGERIFSLNFDRVRPVQKIVVHNDNLFRFNVDYLDTRTGEWKTVHEVRQRRNIGNDRAMRKYVIDRLNFQTEAIRINVSRTVDDRVVSKRTVGPHDKVVGKQRRNLMGRFIEEFRVMIPAIASVREIEVYHLADPQKVESKKK